MTEIGTTIGPLSTFMNSSFIDESDYVAETNPLDGDPRFANYDPNAPPWFGLGDKEPTCTDMVLDGRAKPFYDSYFWDPHYIKTDSGLFFKPESFIIKFYVSPIILSLGILTNLMFLFVLCRVKDMRRVTNFYLGALAISDSIFLIISLTEIILLWTINPAIVRIDPFTSKAQCAAVNALIKFTFYSSVCLVSLVTFERYMAICHSMKHRLLTGKKWTIKVTSVTLTIAAILAVASGLTKFNQETRCFLWPLGLKKILDFYIGDLMTLCLVLDLPTYKQQDRIEAGSAGASFFFFVINMMFNIILYALIIKRLSQREVSKEGSQQVQDNMQRVRNQVARMLVINGTVFFLLNITSEIYNFSWFVGKGFSYEFINATNALTFTFYGNCFRYINSSINPIIYGLSNPRYRQAYLKAFGYESKKSKDGQHSNAQTSVSAVSVTQMKSDRM